MKALIILVVCTRVAPASPDRKHLVTHAAITVGGGVAWIFSETAFKASLAPDACRWCGTNGFDDRVRTALVWHGDHTGTADFLSSLDAFMLVPAIPYLLSVTPTLRSDVNEGFDDALAITEAGV